MFEKDDTVTFPGQHGESQVFHIRAMDGLDEYRFWYGVEAGESPPAERMIDLLRRCLIGWDAAENLRGEDMGEYHADKVRWLSGRVIDFLIGKIITLSRPGDAEKKPLPDSPPSSEPPSNSRAETATVSTESPPSPGNGQSPASATPTDAPAML